MAQHEEEVDQLKYLYNAYTQEYQAVVNEMNSYLQVSASFDRNIEALDKVKSMENTHMLIGLEAGTFVEVSTKEIKNVITNVGAGYLVEKSVKEASEFVGKNSERVQMNITQLLSQKQRLEKEILDLSYKINEMEGAHTH
ncbi:MAG: prefoldin subunit alpha [Candidatus Micrarchaeota archaeon]|nr:prefoldin subunit alpha [Candidatus Micrarchaeota archaeon]